MMLSYSYRVHRILRWATVLTLIAATGACRDSASNPRRGAIPASVTVTSNDLNVASLQRTVQLNVVVRDQQGKEIPDVPLVWTIDQPGVLEQVSGGVFRSLANGEATVHVQVDPSYPGVSAQGYSKNARASVKVVVQQQPAAVNIFPGPRTLWAIQQRSQITARVVDAGGYPIEGDAYPVTWVSDTTSVATIDPATGFVTAVKDGITVIRATGGGFAQTVTVRVSATDPVTACYNASIMRNGIPTTTGQCIFIRITVKDRLPE